MAPTWRRFPARGLLTRLALFALFAGALLVMRHALAERRAEGQDRARALLDGAPTAPTDAAQGGAP